MIILPGARFGRVDVCAAKSQVHRLFILAALCENETEIAVPGGLSADTETTLRALTALGASAERTDGGCLITPIRTLPDGEITLDCGESGTTLRFILPLCGALGVSARLIMRARLAERPLAALKCALTEHGMSIERENGALSCRGQLAAGEYTLDASESSQFVSGLLLALPLIKGESRITITGEANSAGYIEMTEDALRLAGIEFQKVGRQYALCGKQRPHLPEKISAEGDWSGAAGFLCMGALSARGISVAGLNAASTQPDRAVLDFLARFGAETKITPHGVTVRRGEKLRGIEIDAAPVPDLVPVLAAVGAFAEGETRIYNAARLRGKESDRLSATAALITALGGKAEETEDGIIIVGAPLIGGTAESAHDHRIAMAAAVCAGACREAITLDDGECVKKSYPGFWESFNGLYLEKGDEA